MLGVNTMSETETRRVVILTGAAGGIGAATARAVHQTGHVVVLAGRTVESLQGVADQLGDSCLVVPTDLAEPDSCEHLITRTIAEYGRLDALVNNAGHLELAPIAEVDHHMLERSFKVNAIGPILLVKHAWNHFVACDSGCIINISSMASLDPLPQLTAYAAGKSALESLTRSILAERPSPSIRAFNITLGAVETGMLRKLVDEETYPTDQCLTPEQVAEHICEVIDGRHDHRQGEVMTYRKKDLG